MNQDQAHQEYTTAVDEWRWPSAIQVPLPEPFVDDRGKIQNLLLTGCNGVALIESKRGSVRANHAHSDGHYAYVVSGRVLYFERDAGSKEIPEPISFGPGDEFFTPPVREHAMLFAQDTVIITLRVDAREKDGVKRIRTPAEHEKDLRRVELITPDMVARYL